MTDATNGAPEAPRGRPVTGTAKTATERGQAADKALTDAGGRILSRLRLSPEATIALAKLAKTSKSDRTAIENAIIAAVKPA